MRKTVRIGNVEIGGGKPVAIQSMTTTDTKDVESTVRQIKELEDAGVEIVRVSVPDRESANAIAEIKKRIRVPIVADIHFDHRLAMKAIESGADKIRINPGNIGSRWKVEELARFAKERGIPIRVGANTGSLPKEMKDYDDRAVALAESALREVRILESVGFEDIVVSVKSTDVMETVRANEYIASKVNYPIHIGVTEAGTCESAVVKSSMALGHLLMKGVGDTIRVSIAGDPVREVIVARKILTFLGLRDEPEVIACPMCARAVFDVEKIAMEVEKRIAKKRKKIRIAVLGCYVNGIGEGEHADIGIAGLGSNRFIAFRNGRVLGEYGIEDLWRVLDDLLSNA